MTVPSAQRVRSGFSLLPVFAAALLLSGCAAVSPTGGRGLSMPVLAASGIIDRAAADSAPQQVTLRLGRGRVAAEVAVTPAQASAGLAFRTRLASDSAMLFTYPEPHKVVFHMKNTSIPLSVAYIDSLGSILEIHDLNPQDETPVVSRSSAVRFVLEVNRGWFANNGVVPGDRIYVEK